MKDKKMFDLKQNDINIDKEIFSVETDEEVLNCEGSPCNFVYADKK